MQNPMNETAKRAPIEYMRLFVHIRTSEPLRTSSMSSFATKWLNIYPEIEEQPPLPGAHNTSEFEFLDEDNYWPMPFSVFSSPTDGRGMMFQADRVGVFWERIPLQDDDTQYPGFEAMKRTLLELFTDFTTHADQDNISLEPTSVECLYENTLANVLPAECMLGRLTGWSESALASGVKVDESSSFDIHDHADGSHNLPIWISLRPIEEDHATRMLISSIVTHDQDATESLRDNVTHLLETAHQVATDQYTNWVSQKFRSNIEGSA